MKSKVKYLLKNIFLFTISSFVPKMLSFLLVPLYTSYITTSEYGYSDLISTTASLLIPIFTLDIQDAVMRFTLDKDSDKKSIFSFAIRINFIGSILIAIISFVLLQFNILNVPNYFYLFLFLTYTIIAINNTITLFCKGIEKVKSLMISSIINSIVTLLSNILLIVVLKMGVIGYLISTIIGIFVSNLYLIISNKLYKYLIRTRNKQLEKSMIAFSLPLIINVIAWWINNASDRYILTWIAGVSISGIYAISYKIPSILTTFSSILYQAWSISSIKDFDKEDSDGFLGNMYTLANFSLCFVCSLLMLFNVFIAKILYASQFESAWQFVPPLLLSVVFNSMGLFIGSIFTAVKDTKTLSYTTLIGAIINTILNFILINEYGAYGAAIATMIGYFTVLIIRIISLRKHVILKTNNGVNYLTYIFLFTQMIFAYYGNKYIYIQIVCSLSIFLLYHNKISSIISLIKNKIGKKLKKI